MVLSSPGAKVRGTRAGFVLIRLIPKDSAILYPKSVAPIFGIDFPPVAITRLSEIIFIFEVLILYFPFVNLTSSILHSKI